MQRDVWGDRCTRACTRTPKHCCVQILTWPLVAGSSIHTLDSARLLDWSRRLNRCCTRAAFWRLHPFLEHFSPRNHPAADLIPSCLRAFLIPSNCAGCLGNPFKSFLYWDGTLQQGSYSHYLQMHTHMQGGLTQGRPTWILGQETDSSRITPPPPHMNSQHTQGKTSHTAHCPLPSPSPNLRLIEKL